MKIIACYKLVPEEESIKVNSDHSLNFLNVEWKVGQYDLNAVGTGVELVEAVGGEVIALTVGGEIVDNSKLKKAILSRGPSQMYGVMDKALLGADSYTTAQLLKAAVEKIGDADLVLCGEGSGDVYSQQVGSVLGELLGWLTVNAVSKVTAEADKLVVERSLESCVEVLELELPAVISVTSDINLPKIPGMKDILAAGKKPSTIWSLEDIGASAENVIETVSVLAPEQTDRLQIVLEGESEENIETLYNYMRKAL